MIIKVQIEKLASVTSVIGDMNNCHLPLTFHAYSDEMKARMLEQFVKSPARIGISICDDIPRNGEWHEAFAANCVFNR